MGTPSRNSKRKKKRAERENEGLIKSLNRTIEETKEILDTMNEKETFIDVRVRKYRSLLDEQSIRLCTRHLLEGNDYILVKKKTTNGMNNSGTNSDHSNNGNLQIQVPDGADEADALMNTSTTGIGTDIGTGTGTGTTTQCDNTDEYIIDVEKEAQIKKQFQIQADNEQKLETVLEVQRKILTEMEICRRKLIDLQKKRDDLILKREECEDFLIASAQVDVLVAENANADADAKTTSPGHCSNIDHMERGGSTRSNGDTNFEYSTSNKNCNHDDLLLVTKEDTRIMEMVTLTSKRVDASSSPTPMQVI